MKIAYTVLEVDRHENANLIRSKISFLDEMKTLVCDARKEYPDCINKYPQYRHVFNSITNVGLIGLWISELNAFYSLLESDYDALLIFEDDAVLVDDFEYKFKACLEELPSEFGMFSMGYSNIYLNHYTPEHLIDKNNICRIFQTGDSFTMLYNKECVREMLDRIVKYKILGGFPDTAMISYALKNVHPLTDYKSYSTIPTLGSLSKHEENRALSTLQNSFVSGEHIKYK